MESGNRGCLPFIKFWLGIFVRVVYHFPKISGLSRFVRLASSYNMKLGKLVRNLKRLVNDKRISIRNVSTGKTGLPFQKFRLSRKFSSETNQKKPFTIYIPTGISGKLWYMVNNPSNWSKYPPRIWSAIASLLFSPVVAVLQSLVKICYGNATKKIQITRKHITIPGTKKNILFMICACLVRYPKVAECSRLRAVVFLFSEPCAASEKAKLSIMMVKRGRVSGVSFFFRASAFVPRVFTASPFHLTRARDQL